MKLINKEYCVTNCPNCGSEITCYGRCDRCNKLVEPRVEEIEKKVKERITGIIRWYAFLPAESKIFFFTSHNRGRKENLHLYDYNSDDFIWSVIAPFLTVRNIFCIEDKIVVVSRNFERSLLTSFDINTGKLFSKIQFFEPWTNAISFKNDVIIGCRNGFLYRYDKNLKLVHEICLKEDPKDNNGSYYSNPAPFNLVTNQTESLVAFSSRTMLYMLDANLNVLWTNDIGASTFGRKKSISKEESPVYVRSENNWAFDALEVVQGSTINQIKKAFRNKALKWHPDRHPEKTKKKRKINSRK
jgi:DnaJ-class molecular chaperone with C-terminal Zn finger domain